MTGALKAQNIADLFQRKAAYEALHPEAAHGAATKNKDDKLSSLSKTTERDRLLGSLEIGIRFPFVDWFGFRIAIESIKRVNGALNGLFQLLADRHCAATAMSVPTRSTSGR